MIECSECEAYKAANANAGICQLNPPKLNTNLLATSVESYYQPHVYNDQGCAQGELKVKKPTRKR